MNIARIMIISAWLASAAGLAYAADFRSVSAPVVLHDAPSAKGRKVFVAPRGMPVEVVLTYGEWTKVRDAAGDLAWVESRMLVPRRTLVVNVAHARIRENPSDASQLVFTAERGVLLDLVEPAAAGWVRVRHRDGQGGFVRVSEVWGE